MHYMVVWQDMAVVLNNITALLEGKDMTNGRTTTEKTSYIQQAVLQNQNSWRHPQSPTQVLRVL